MKRLIIAGLAFCWPITFVTSAISEGVSDPQKELADEAYSSWTKCITFEMQQNLRRFGDVSSPEELADLTMSSCAHMEAVVRSAYIALVKSEEGRARVELILNDQRINIHGIIVKGVVASKSGVAQ